MSTVLVCGNIFDGTSDGVSGPGEILVEDDRIVEVAESVGRPAGADVIDLTGRTVTPGFIDCHVHLTSDGSALQTQTLDSSATKALTGLSRARRYMARGFTALRDLGTMDPEWPTVDLRNAIDDGTVVGPRLVVAGHLIGSTGSHADLGGLYPPRWNLQPTPTADGVAQVREHVRREHKHGVDWIKTANAGSYFDVTDDPARLTWFDDELSTLVQAADQHALPVAVHTGGAEACKQAIRAGVRSLEHVYLMDEEAVAMAEQAGVFVVPTMQMNQEDLRSFEQGEVSGSPQRKLRRDHDQVLAAQRRVAASDVKIAYGTDCGFIPFDDGINEFQAMVRAGLSNVRALKAATGVAAELLERDDLGVLEAGRRADIVAMPADPTVDISATTGVDFVMSAGSVFRGPGTPAG
jgi:imidazolonepropionase-like amidohydrolase